MTETGNHGGGSTNETSTALFAYNKKGFSRFRSNYKEIFHFDSDCKKTVSQMDLVPTISVLFGIPIPFHSLGCFLPDFILDNFDTS